jgi:short-subunit dehydrogenase
MNAQGESRPAVVVTGASGGIGREIAKEAAREGGPVVLIARSAEALAGTAEEVRAAGGEPFTLVLDLSQRDAPAEVERYLAGQNLLCDVLVNNAGYGLLGWAATLPRDEQLGIVDLNIRALADLTLRFLPGMIVRRRGGIINLASVASFLPGPGMALYYASKAFVRSFSEALTEEVRGTGVTVTCVAPGPVATDFLRRSGAKGVRLFKMVPKMTAEGVAKSGWRAFKRGRRLVVPGASASLSAIASAYLPHPLLLPVVARLQLRRKGGSRPGA